MIYNYPISFGGTDLSNLDGIKITDFEINRLPDRTLQMFKLARRNRSILTSAEYSSKEVTITGFVMKNTRAESESSYARLKSYLQPINSELRVAQYGTNVVYTATLYSIDQHYIGNALNFVIILTISDPIGREYTTTSLIAGTTVTTQALDTPVTIDGSFLAEPYFTITVNSLTGGTGQNITIKNSDTGEGITVNRTWTGGDILNIDSRNRTVSVNGTEVDYSGIFPRFVPGTRSVGYIDSLTTRNVTLTAEYYKRYV